jgi:hypothetical protein
MESAQTKEVASRRLILSGSRLASLQGTLKIQIFAMPLNFRSSGLERRKGEGKQQETKSNLTNRKKSSNVHREMHLFSSLIYTRR